MFVRMTVAPEKLLYLGEKGALLIHFEAVGVSTAGLDFAGDQRAEKGLFVEIDFNDRSYVEVDERFFELSIHPITHGLAHHRTDCSTTAPPHGTTEGRVIIHRHYPCFGDDDFARWGVGPTPDVVTAAAKLNLFLLIGAANRAFPILVHKFFITDSAVHNVPPLILLNEIILSQHTCSIKLCWAFGLTRPVCLYLCYSAGNLFPHSQ